MKEEDKAMEEGAMQAKAGTIKGNPGNKTSTTNKTPQTHKAERQEEGGAPMLDRATKTTLPNVDIVAILATTRLSVAKRRTSWLSQVDNSQITHPTSTTTIVEDFFVMRHRANFMTASNPTNTSKLEDVWFVDSGASNHMTYHEDWFKEL